MRITIFSLMIVLAIPGMSYSKEKIILDTDPAIGYPFRDVDDGLAIALALNSPELEVLGIVTSYGNHTQEKTNMKAHEIVDKASLTGQVPVYRGADGPEDLGMRTEGSRFIAETVKKYPGEVTIIAIGTTTNVATALMDPEAARSVKRIVAMGGWVIEPGAKTSPLMVELNFRADYKSTTQVLQTEIPFVWIHAELCTQTVLTWPRYIRMKKEAPFLRKYLARKTLGWMLLNTSGLLGDRWGFYPWDLLAIAYVLDEEMFQDKEVSFEATHENLENGLIEICRSCEGADVISVNAPESFDIEAFWELFFDRI